jgi:hypothetical protein
MSWKFNEQIGLNMALSIEYYIRHRYHEIPGKAKLDAIYFFVWDSNQPEREREGGREKHLH